MWRWLSKITVALLVVVAAVVVGCSSPPGIVCFPEKHVCVYQGKCVDLLGIEVSDEECGSASTNGDSPSDGSDDPDDKTEGVPDEPAPDCTKCVVKPGEDDDGDCVPNAAEVGDAVPGRHASFPNDSDSDDDGIPDGCEDKNYDGFVQVGETDARNIDSDADCIDDNKEDTNLNGRRDAGETSASKGDSDGDGIVDGRGGEDRNCNGLVDSFGDLNGDGCWSEGTEPPGESNPRSLDSDSDSLSDRVEDSNANGECDPGETCAWSRDRDCDGLMDGVEDLNLNGRLNTRETDPLNPDTDGDCIIDGKEDSNYNGRFDGGETDPRKVDTDGDFIPDGRASNATCAPNCPVGEDANCNGVVDDFAVTQDVNRNGCWDPGELAGETDPREVDSDDDGVDDGIEDINHDGICQTEMLSDPLKPTQIVRTFVETCGWLLDTDCDGLPEDKEDHNGNGGAPDVGETDPRRLDTDGDGLLDGYPRWLAENKDAALGGEDTDNNGITGAGETHPLDYDTDSDGLGDGCEIQLGTDALNPDSDGDGAFDGEEDANHNCIADDPTNPTLADPGPTAGSEEYPEWMVCAAGNLKALTFAETPRATLNYKLAFEVEDGQPYIVQAFGLDNNGNGFDENTMEDAVWGHIFQSPAGTLVDEGSGQLMNRYVYGFVLGTEDGRALDDILDTIRTSLTAKYPDFEELPAVTARVAHDSLPNYPILRAQRRFNIALGESKRPRAVRAEILRDIFLQCGGITGEASCNALPSICGWSGSACVSKVSPSSVLSETDPVGTAQPNGRFSVYVSAVQRSKQLGPTGAPVVLITLALTPDDSRVDTTAARLYAERVTRLQDLTGGSALARYENGLSKNCEPHNTAVAKADLLWVLDDSASMQKFLKRLQTAAGDAKAVLTANRNIVDFRVGTTTTNPSPAARTKCYTTATPADCKAANDCADDVVKCVSTCANGGGSAGSPCTGCGCVCSGSNNCNSGAYASGCTGLYDSTCVPEWAMASRLALEANGSYPLPGGGGRFYYEDSQYFDCDVAVRGIGLCSSYVGFESFYSAGQRVALTNNAGMLRAAPDQVGSCTTALLDISEKPADTRTNCATNPSYCCERLTSTCEDGPTVLASQMCDLIRAMGGSPDPTGAIAEVSGATSSRAHSGTEMAVRQTRQLLENMLPALPANSSDVNAKYHLRLDCCSSCDPSSPSTNCRSQCCRSCNPNKCPSNDPDCCSHPTLGLDCNISSSCAPCDPRDASYCPIVPPVVIMLSDEEDFWFKDDCGTSRLTNAPSQDVVDHMQLPARCRYADAYYSASALPNPETEEECPEAHCRQFDTKPPPGYNPDISGVDNVSSLKLRPACSRVVEGLCKSTPGCSWTTTCTATTGVNGVSCAPSNLCNMTEGCAWANNDCRENGTSCSASYDSRETTCVADPCPFVEDQTACNTQWNGRCKWNTLMNKCKSACSFYYKQSGEKLLADKDICLADPNCSWNAGAMRSVSVENLNPYPCQPKYPLNDCQACKRARRTLDAVQGEGYKACKNYTKEQCDTKVSCVWDAASNLCAADTAAKCAAINTSTSIPAGVREHACRASFMCKWDATNGCTQRDLIGFNNVGGRVYAVIRDKGEPGRPDDKGVLSIDDCRGADITWGRGDGQSYRDIATKTAGSVQNVCANSYSYFMNQVIKDIVVLSVPYPLTAPPIASTIKVGISRKNASGGYEYFEVPRSDTQGFIYDPTANSIGFKSDPVDNDCRYDTSGGICHADGVFEASEISSASQAPHIPVDGDIVYISYRSWLPVPCEGACADDQTCMRVLCSADRNNNPAACSNGTCALWPMECVSGQCLLDCEVGSVIERCVPSVACDACQQYDAGQGKCVDIADGDANARSCLCPPAGATPCTPGLPGACAPGMHCGEGCTCELNTSCRDGFNADGSVNNCDEAKNCCAALRENEAICNAQLSQELCGDQTDAYGCRWDTQLGCVSDGTPCCTESELAKCVSNGELGKDFITCVETCECVGTPCTTGLECGTLTASGEAICEAQKCKWTGSTCVSKCEVYQSCLEGHCMPKCKPLEEFCDASTTGCECRLQSN